MSLEKVDNGFRSIEEFFTVISWIVIIFITLLVVTDVTLRYLFNNPLPAAWEIAEVCMPAIVFLPFALTATLNQHVKVCLVRDRVSPVVQKLFDILNYSMCIVMCSLLTYWSWIRFWGSFVSKEEILAAIYIPWWPGKLAMPIGMAVFTVRYLLLLLAVIALSKKAKCEIRGGV